MDRTFHSRTGMTNVSGNAQLYYMDKPEILKSKITRSERFINFLSRIVRSLTSRKISVFTQNIERMNNKTYFRLNFNKHIQVFRDTKNTEDNHTSKIGGESGLNKDSIEKLAKQTFYKELENTTAMDNDPITIKIPSYSTNPSEGNQTYDQYINNYIHTIDLCLRIAKKDQQIKNDRKLKIIFSSQEQGIIQEENLALKKINDNVFEYLDQYIEYNNKKILHLIEAQSEDDKTIAPITKNLNDSTETPKLDIENKLNKTDKNIAEGEQKTKPESNSTIINEATPNNIGSEQHNLEAQSEADKKKALITKNLDNCEDIETRRKIIESERNKITDQNIVAEKQKIEAELKQNNYIDFGIIKICIGSIENTDKLGMKNAYIMNAANARGADGHGVTGAIYKASGHSKNITKQFQQELKNNKELTRTNDDNQSLLYKNKDLYLAMGKILVTDAFDIPSVNGIVHAVAPNIKKEDEALQGKDDIEVAIATNSFEKAIRLAASKKNDTAKPCDSLALVLLGGNIFGGNQLNILTALKIASDRLKNESTVKDFDIRLVLYQAISPDQQEIIAQLRATDAIES